MLDVSHQYAAGNACAIRADLGADVLQVEDPDSAGLGIGAAELAVMKESGIA